MGLGIRVIGNLKKVNKLTDEELEECNVYIDNPYMKERADGLKGGYIGEALFDFHAGSYSGYGEWRNWLSLAIHDVTSREIWTAWKAWEGSAFYELINFSDCEGCIGPVTSAKLSKDFEDYRDKLPPSDHEYIDGFLEKYENWAKAFKLAAENNGVVGFC